MRNKFKMFISFTLVIAMLTSCRSSSFDNSKHSSNMDSSLETANDTLDISESNYSSTEDESEDNYDDYSFLVFHFPKYNPTRKIYELNE